MADCSRAGVLPVGCCCSHCGHVCAMCAMFGQWGPCTTQYETISSSTHTLRVAPASGSMLYIIRRGGGGGFKSSLRRTWKRCSP